MSDLMVLFRAGNSTIYRILLAGRIVSQTFGKKLSPILVSVWFISLRIAMIIPMALDGVFFSGLRSTYITSPIIIVGNPRTGTTFLQRFLCDNQFGAGLQLYRMVFPSLIIQTLITPIIPWLEAISPAKYHKTSAHKTDLESIETDDVSLLFRYFDGFFLYGFILAHAQKDYTTLFDPTLRDTSTRDFDWLEKLWKRSLVFTGQKRIVAKLFSAGLRMQTILDRFPDARILYMVRDPIAVIPSAMSLITGVLDRAYGFWDLPKERRNLYLERLYVALVGLLSGFQEDWTKGQFDQSRIHIVHYDRMMYDFEGFMREVCDFTGHAATPEQLLQIRLMADQQRAYKSEHHYDLERFGLDADRIRRDTAGFTELFIASKMTVSS